MSNIGEASTSYTTLKFNKLSGETYTGHAAIGAMTSAVKLIPITSYPKLFQAPERLDASTMSSNVKKYEQGMADFDTLEFGFVYNKGTASTQTDPVALGTGFTLLKEMEELNKPFEFTVCFGNATDDDAYGSFTFAATLYAGLEGGEADDARKGTITLYPQSSITMA